MADPVTGYWFAKASSNGRVRLPHQDRRLVRVGESLSVKPPIVLCAYGLHASRRVLDALTYAPGPMLAVVELSGSIIEGNDKLVATTRTVLWMQDVSTVLHHAACDFAERALHREEQAGQTVDPRSWAAIETTRRWLAGTATDDEREIARSVAGAATWVAARVVARAAAWNADWDAKRAWQEAHLLQLLRQVGMPNVREEETSNE